MIFAVLVLVGLLLTKYYSETALRKLRSKTNEEQKSLEDVRKALLDARNERAEAEKMDNSTKLRLEKIRAFVTDMEVEIQESYVQRIKEGTDETAGEGKGNGDQIGIAADSR